MWPCEADTHVVGKLNSNHHKAYWQTFIRPLLKFWCWNMCRGLEDMDLIGKQQIFLYMYIMEETSRWRHRVLFWIVIKMKLILPFAMLLISVASLELNFGELPNKGRYDKTGRVLRPLGAAAFNIQELAKFRIQALFNFLKVWFYCILQCWQMVPLGLFSPRTDHHAKTWLVDRISAPRIATPTISVARGANV